MTTTQLTLPTYQDVLDAAERIQGHAHRTPGADLTHVERTTGGRGVLQVRELPAHGRFQVPRCI